MSDIVIAAENLSKSYLVGHQSSARERYTALRDVLAREARNFARKGLDFVRGRQIVQGDEVEEFWALRSSGAKCSALSAATVLARVRCSRFSVELPSPREDALPFADEYLAS